MFNWDDLKFFIEVSKSLNLAEVSRKLEVDQTTVYRRILRIEKKTGKKLIKKIGGGYSLTVWGEGLANISTGLDEQIKKIENYLEEEVTEIFGTLNITTTNVIADVVLPGIVCEFKNIYPDLNIEITVCEDFFDMFKREADIAIRSSDTVEPHVHAIKIGKGGWALYSSEDYLRNKKVEKEKDFFKVYDFILGSERIASIKSTVWLETKVDNNNVVLRVNSMPSIYSAVKSGIGIGMLPSIYKKYDSNLVELSKPDPKFGSTIWLIAHSDLIRNEKIKICLDYFESELKKIFTY